MISSYSTRCPANRIVDIQLARVEKLLNDRGVRLEVTPQAKELLVAEGYDPQYGARPMRRAIQRLVQDPLALKLLSGEFLSGDTVLVDKDGDALRFEKRALATA